MTVLDRTELQASPLADLHAIANEMGIDGYRLLRREELIAAILAGGAVTARDLRERAAAVKEDELAEIEGEGARTRTGAGRSRRAPRRAPRRAAAEPAAEPAQSSFRTGEVVEGVIELRAGGAAVLRAKAPDGGEEEVAISPSQVKRCELKNGDRVSGPVRRRRRTQGSAALVRVETINGVPADLAVQAPPPARERGRRERAARTGGPAFPEERLELGGDPALRELEALAPLGFGSRALIAGPTRAGKSELLAHIAQALAGRGDLDCQLVLSGVRPEEIGSRAEGAPAPVSALTFTASAQERLQALEPVLAKAERVCASGGRALVLIDTLDGLEAGEARRVMAHARNERGAGSLTIIATAGAPFGGETSVVTLSGEHAPGQPFSIDPQASGTLKVELLVGEQGAAAIARERAARLRRRRSLLSRLLGR
ncbi:MAG TPA: Rho termination factor N-terminal domain-containing protein [Solirubrobacteraceae bacterium]|nr:Rho termination factor N-terminal domain-containing protein [Solirubrobacteraceae bacterium]